MTSVIVVHFFFLDLHHKHKLYKLRNTVDTEIKEAEEKKLTRKKIFEFLNLAENLISPSLQFMFSILEPFITVVLVENKSSDSYLGELL